MDSPSAPFPQAPARTLDPHFHFETLPPNLWIVAIINIHAGVNAVKTLSEVTPNG